MKEENYQEFLKTVPQDHFSDEFVNFLKNNNEVVDKAYNWLIIKNIKYHGDWLTAFYIGWRIENGSFNQSAAIADMWQLIPKYKDREWLIKAPHKRSVKLFHVHMYKKM